MSEATDRNAIRLAALAARKRQEPGDDHDPQTCMKPICVETRKILAEAEGRCVTAELG